MIKPRIKPIRLQKVEAILPRLTTGTPLHAELKKELAQRMKGYIGEKEVDYHLDILSHQAMILQNVNLRHNGKNFQMDHSLISPHAKYIVETKNIQGTVTFDTTYKQLIREDGEKETGFDYPITQVEMQKLKLEQWFEAHQLFEIPIFYFIAISHPSTIIKVKGDDTSIKKIVAHANNIPLMIMEKEKQLQQTNHPTIQRHNISQIISKYNKEPDFDILSAYNINPKEIKPGIRCPHCDWLGMRRMYNNWACSNCGQKSRHAYKTALNEFFLLIHPWITNKMGRYWLNVASKDVITRLFKKEKLIYNAKRKVWLPPPK